MNAERDPEDPSKIAAAASDLRQRGNHEFSNGRYDAALALYSTALEQCLEEENDDAIKEERLLNLCNRSACYYQMEEYEESQKDAALAWEISNQTSVKAAYRLAKSYWILKEYENAKEIIQAALRVLDDQELVNESITPAAAAKHASDSSRSFPSRRGSKNQQEPDKPQEETTTTTSTTTTTASMQRKSLQELWKQVLAAAYEKEQNPTEATTTTETSIRFVKRPISIKEFIMVQELGCGNFSEIVSVQHKATGEIFALKKIAKKQAADLYKRQHPNVYNEIQMERRVLLERLGTRRPSGTHPFIIRMFHAFQDYNTLYFLMELHNVNTDLWSQMFCHVNNDYHATTTTESPKQQQRIMMGCHRSTAKLWLYQLISALEYMHAHGIVHRDLKPENVLLNQHNHVVVIDFGTAKDLIYTDLNGPEFVGTPDYMSPEAVQGKERDDDDEYDDKAPSSSTYSGKMVAQTPADLWALGAIAYNLMTGCTPYWSPSPYLAFLKIKRALQYSNLRRNMGIVDDECWDFIRQLMQGKASQRLGASVFQVQVVDNETTTPKEKARRKMVQTDPEGYNILRNHPYFQDIRQEQQQERKNKFPSVLVPIPSLVDLCIRATAEMAYRDSLDVDLCDRHPPGDGSRHDLMRLKPRERQAVMHCLNRRKLLADPRLYARFFDDPVAARLDKIRKETHDVVGLTQMNDDEGKPPKAKMNDPYAKPIDSGIIQIVYLSNPIFGLSSEEEFAQLDETTRKTYTKLLKKCIANINRSRPRLVVVSGTVPTSIRKILSRISETIPVVVHDGSTFFTFWCSGVQCMAIQSSTFMEQNGDTCPDDSEQMFWLREQLELVRISKHPSLVFVDCDPRKLPRRVLKRLARGRTLCLFGPLPPATDQPEIPSASTSFSTSVSMVLDYKANEIVDDATIRSTDSEEDEKDDYKMKIIASCENGLHWISVEEEPDVWDVEFKSVELPTANTGD